MKLEALVAKQKKFFDSGKTKEVRFRMAALKRLELAIKAYESQIQKALYFDLHKSGFEAYMTEIGLALSELAYLQRHLPGWAKEKTVPTPLAQFKARSSVMWEPYGTVLVMSPWNYPLMLCLEPLMGAVAAGNCCIVKPSAYAPETSHVIRKMIEEYFPSKYIAVVEGGRAENAALLDQNFDYIFFTGGVTVGKLVMEKAAAHLTPVTLELGGKSPCIVDETANLKLAAKRLVFGKFLNSGQTCVAPDYLFVQDSVKEEFLGNVKYWIRKFLGEEPLQNPDYPQMVNQKHYERVMNLLKQENAIVGGYGNLKMLQIAPTVLEPVSPHSPVMQEEIFGPVLPVLTYRSLDEVESYVRSHPKPLALYLFTTDKAVEKRIFKNLSFGGGCVNDTIIHLATSHMGFGGVGQSGMGSYHGRDSFETFSHKKSIVRKSNAVDLPIRYMPYSAWKYRLLRAFLR